MLGAEDRMEISVLARDGMPPTSRSLIVRFAKRAPVQVAIPATDDPLRAVP